MNYIQILILALIQGAAELLPISSTAHVILAARLMGYKDTSNPEFVFLLVMLHTGTMFAVLYYFWQRWRRWFSPKSEIGNRKSETNPKSECPKPEPRKSGVLNFVLRICFGFRASDFEFQEQSVAPDSPRFTRFQFFKMIALATACTGVLGLGLLFLIEKVVLIKMLGHEKGEVEDLFKSLPLMAAALVSVGVFIIIAGVVSTRRARITKPEIRNPKSETNPKSESPKPEPVRSGVLNFVLRMCFGFRASDFEFQEITPRISILIGLVQGLCLPFRGFSRSGATISTALLCGVDRMRAEDFSFALAVALTPPVIIRELYRLLRDADWTGNTHLVDLLLPGLLGMGCSFVAGLAALHILSAALEKGRWKYFGYYCIAFSLIVLWAAWMGY
ncbi:MAG TPA: undecaprenyl-diphosphate phosphatase [Gemmataceae bacterium]|nr:undecaprenyl-diphosphate phosphatase [Gemmataceae bacterium]